jgi:hypothetical protein
MKKIFSENEYAKFEIKEGILIGAFKSAFVDLDTAFKITEKRLELQNGKNYPILSNIKLIKSSTKSARDFMASEDGCKGVIAAAIIIDSPIGRIIGNFFIKISKPLRPTKIFTNENEAKKWLTKYLIKD